MLSFFKVVEMCVKDECLNFRIYLDNKCISHMEISSAYFGGRHTLNKSGGLGENTRELGWLSSSSSRSIRRRKADKNMNKLIALI